MTGKICDCVKLDDVLDLDEGKSLGKLLAEEYDRKICKDIVAVLKKYFPNTEVNEERVLKLAKMLIAEETEKGGAE